MANLRKTLHTLRDRSFVTIAGWAVISAVSMAMAFEEPQVEDGGVLIQTKTDAVSCLRPENFEAMRRCGAGRY